MVFTNGLAKDEFLQHVFEEFPSVFDNTFSRTMLENIVNYGTADNFTHTKNQLYYFLKDMIPEIEPKDLIPFMDRNILTNEVLHEFLPASAESKTVKTTDELWTDDYSKFSTEDLVEMEKIAYADYYKLATRPRTNPSPKDLEPLEKATATWEAICEELETRKQPLMAQISSASIRAAGSKSTSPAKTKVFEPEI